MANLWVSESSGLIAEPDGSIAQLWVEPSSGTQKITFTTATQSTAFKSDTRLIRFQSDADCNITFGTNPTATSSSPRYSAGVEYFRVLAYQGLKLSVYDGTS